MKNVLHLINTGGPGGAETVYVELVRRLDPRRWGAVAVAPNREWMFDRLVEMGQEPVLLRSHARFDHRYMGGLWRLIRERNVRLIHSHFFGPSVTASILGLACNVPAVSTIHGEGDMAAQESFRALKLGLLRRGADRVVFVSEALRRSFLARGELDPRQTEVIPNGIGPEFFISQQPALRQEFGAGPEDFLVGAVGNLRWAKGYDVLLRAFSILRQRSPAYRLVIVGQAEGELYHELLALRDELGLAGHVVFTGFRDDVPAILAALDVYAMSSRSEGFSLSTVQAMAGGLPIVATRCGGPETILRDGVTGLFTEPESPAGLADAISFVREHREEGARLGAQARRVARERYSVQEQVRRYEELYEACIAARGTPRWNFSSARVAARASGATRG